MMVHHRGRSAKVAPPRSHPQGRTAMNEEQAGWTTPRHTGLLVLSDGTVLEGFGLGAAGHAVGEVCFNTAMTGYEEILTHPSYARQIDTLTFPHIGNAHPNEQDIRTV